MKQLTSTPVTAMEAAPTPVTPVNWQLECNKLREQVLTLKRRIATLENPPRTAEQLEQNMLAVRNFVTSMSLTEGAVTCANLYNRTFFTSEQDGPFVKALCSYLVEHFKMSSALIEDTFALWQSLQR